MKFKRLFLMGGALLFLSACRTNNFCKIDKEAIHREAVAWVDQTARTDFLGQTDLISEKQFDIYLNTWLVSNPDKSRTEPYADGFVTDYQATEYYTKAINEREKVLSTSCITLEDIPGEVNSDETMIREKNWIDAIKQGPIELFIVFPVSALIITLMNLFGATAAASPQTIALGSIAAIVIVTILIRTLIFLFTFKSTLMSQRMQEIQPEVAEIQAKYAGINSPEARTRQGQEIMKLYEKHNIKMLAAFAGPFLTIPVFLAMWGALNETRILKDGILFNVSMGTSVHTYIFGKNFAVFALILYLVSLVAQLVLLKLPQWKQKARIQKKRIVLNQKAQAQQQQMKMMPYFMMAMMAIIGLTIPVAMAIYFLTSNIFAIGLSFFVDYLIKRRRSKNGSL